MAQLGLIDRLRHAIHRQGTGAKLVQQTTHRFAMSEDSLHVLIWQRSTTKGNSMLFDSRLPMKSLKAGNVPRKSPARILLGEMVFGSVPITLTGVNTKVHFIRDDRQVMVSMMWVFIPQVNTMREAVARQQVRQRVHAGPATSSSSASSSASSSSATSVAAKTAKKGGSRKSRIRAPASLASSPSRGAPAHIRGKKLKATFAMSLVWNVSERVALQEWIFRFFSILETRMLHLQASVAKFLSTYIDLLLPKHNLTNLSFVSYALQDKAPIHNSVRDFLNRLMTLLASPRIRPLWACPKAPHFFMAHMSCLKHLLPTSRARHRMPQEPGSLVARVVTSVLRMNDAWFQRWRATTAVPNAASSIPSRWLRVVVVASPRDADVAHHLIRILSYFLRHHNVGRGTRVPGCEAWGTTRDNQGFVRLLFNELSTQQEEEEGEGGIEGDITTLDVNEGNECDDPTTSPIRRPVAMSPASPAAAAAVPPTPMKTPALGKGKGDMDDACMPPADDGKSLRRSGTVTVTALSPSSDDDVDEALLPDALGPNSRFLQMVRFAWGPHRVDNGEGPREGGEGQAKPCDAGVRGGDASGTRSGVPVHRGGAVEEYGDAGAVGVNAVADATHDDDDVHGDDDDDDHLFESSPISTLFGTVMDGVRPTAVHNNGKVTATTRWQPECVTQALPDSDPFLPLLLADVANQAALHPKLASTDPPKALVVSLVEQTVRLYCGVAQGDKWTVEERNTSASAHVECVLSDVLHLGKLFGNDSTPCMNLLEDRLRELHSRALSLIRLYQRNDSSTSREGFDVEATAKYLECDTSDMPIIRYIVDRMHRHPVSSSREVHSVTS